jgi:hypothetical protein
VDGLSEVLTIDKEKFSNALQGVSVLFYHSQCMNSVKFP